MSTKGIIGLLAGAALFVWVAMFLVAMSTRGSVVSGFGNGGNHIYADPTRDQLADLLVSSGSAPTVGSEDLAAIYSAIDRKARAGDLDAALVVLQVGARQRKGR